VPLHNTHEALDVEDKAVDDAGVDPSTSEEAQRSEGPPSRITTSSTRRKRRVIVVGHSQLRGTEGPICRADPPLREVCCLPGARV